MSWRNEPARVNRLQGIGLFIFILGACPGCSRGTPPPVAEGAAAVESNLAVRAEDSFTLNVSVMDTPAPPPAVAFKSGDTESRISEFGSMRRSGKITTGLLSQLRRLTRDTAERRILSLALAVRSTASADAAELNGFSSPLAQVLIPMNAKSVAEAYLDLGIPARAARLLRAELRRNPADRSLLPSLVRASRLAGDSATAFAHVSRALAREPDAADLHIISFEREKQIGDRAMMIATLERIGTLPSVRDRTDIQNLIRSELPKAYIAEAAAHIDDRRRVLFFLEKARELDRQDPTIHFNIAMIHSLSGEVDTALAALDECFRIQKDDVDALILAASLLKKQGRNSEAASAYQKAIAAGASVNVRHDLALLLENQGETHGAYVAAAEARRLDTSSARIARTYGVLAARLERWPEALEPLRECAKVFPHDGDALRLLARAYVECGHHDTAKSMTSRFSNPLDRLDIFSRINLAKGRPDIAVKTLRPHSRLPRFQGLFSAVLSASADKLLIAGRLAEARILWREWQSFDSTATMPRALLAEGHSDTVATTAASAKSESIQQSAQAKPQQSVATPAQAAEVAIIREPSLRQAAEAMKAGDYSGAEAVARKIINKNPSNSTAWNLLGLSLAQQGRKPEAVDAFRESLRIRPDQPEVRAALEESDAT